MAKKEFILQGFTTRTHANVVSALFDVHNVKRVLISVAFANDGGAELIEKPLSSHADKATVFVGIRNEVTTFQGLARLFATGLNLYAVDTGARTLIFHPKLYMVRGEKEARAIIGSANLTLGGLNNNIEAGILLAFDLTNKDDKEVVDSIENEFDALPKSYPQHVLKIGNKADLELMLDNGRLLDEMAARPPRPVSVAKTSKGDTVPRIKLKVAPLFKTITKSSKPKAKKAAPAGKVATTTPIVLSKGVELELVWESKPLTERDLNIPSGANTNATGSINLDKGLLPSEIDHRHYFREDIFPDLTWVAGAGAVETASAKFSLVLKGISHGEFDLTIRHTTGTTSKTYLQKNAMTRLSWGDAHEHIARKDLIGRTLSLYRDKADVARFVLEID